MPSEPGPEHQDQDDDYRAITWRSAPHANCRPVSGQMFQQRDVFGVGFPRGIEYVAHSRNGAQQRVDSDIHQHSH
jgi:hypothetical protein